jgi:hypothetical protein
MYPHKTRESSAAAVRSNITMVAMGIGGPTDISYTELMDVANNITDNFLWLKTLTSFLQNGTQVLHERICSGKTMLQTKAKIKCTYINNGTNLQCYIYDKPKAK